MECRAQLMIIREEGVGLYSCDMAVWRSLAFPPFGLDCISYALQTCVLRNEQADPSAETS